MLKFVPISCKAKVQKRFGPNDSENSKTCYRNNHRYYNNRITHQRTDYFNFLPVQAQAALMYDAVFVLIDAFNKLLRKKPDQFRSTYTSKRGNQPSYTNSTSGINGSSNMNGIMNNFNTLSGSMNSNNNRLLDCNIPKGHHPTPWEHGDKISRYLRKVSMEQMSFFLVLETFIYSMDVT